MDIQEAYNRWSLSYDADTNRTRDLDQQVTRRLLADTRVRSILEIGCGTGKNTGFLGQIGERVHAVDFSQAMIARARHKHPGEKFTFSVADITRQWPCRDQSFELVVCNLVLEHVTDLRFVFSEAKRSLTGGGRFFVCELHPFRQYQGVQASFEHNQRRTEIKAFVHNTSDFLHAATEADMVLQAMDEWWHEDDEGNPPRLLSLRFTKGTMEGRDSYIPVGDPSKRRTHRMHSNLR